MDRKEILERCRAERRALPAAHLHRHRRHHQERRGARPASSRRRWTGRSCSTARRSRGSSASRSRTCCCVPTSTPSRSTRGTTRDGKVGAAHLRHLQPRRDAVRRLSPRGAQAVVAQAAERGYAMMVGPEAEFFLFQRDTDGSPDHETHDVGGYFDLGAGRPGRGCAPRHRRRARGRWGSRSRRRTTRWRTASTRSTSATPTPLDDGRQHHHVPVRREERGQDATACTPPSCPSRIFGHRTARGMHTHQSLFDRRARTRSSTPTPSCQLSSWPAHYIGGHPRARAAASCAITNPLVNSYKRLVPGYEAPVNVAWSRRTARRSSGSPTAAGQGPAARCASPTRPATPTWRSPSCSRPGSTGSRRDARLPRPGEPNIFEMSEREKRRLRIRHLPAQPPRRARRLERDRVVRAALGEHIYTNFLRNKREEWHAYISAVHDWEREQYLEKY